MIAVPLPDPVDAAVSRPWASTVMFAFVYDPGVTAVLASETVLLVLRSPPPLNPVPAVIVVAASAGVAPLEAAVSLP